MKARPKLPKGRYFSTILGKNKGTCFSPFSLIDRVISKTKRKKSCTVVLTPAWQTQRWYTIVQHGGTTCQYKSLASTGRKCVDEYPRENLSLFQRHQLKLVTTTMSGNLYLRQVYQNRLLNLC